MNQPNTNSSSNFTSVVSILPVKDHAKALAWYKSWIGRDPDLVPMEGMAEWNVVEGGWIQVGLDPENAGGTTAVLGVRSLEQQLETCVQAKIKTSEVQDHGFIKMFTIKDPDGNQVAFVQEVAGET